MKVPLKAAFYLLILALALATASAQDENGSAPRKLVRSPKPPYPALARTMNLSGTVRLEALVEPNGSVKSVEIKGGNPLLAQSAQFAVRDWKWEKAEHATTQLLEVRFAP